MMQLKDLNPHPGNPRKITDEKLKMLKKSLAEFGDLGCVVFNAKTRRLVGGHQRLKVLPPDAEITYEEKYTEPTRTGTIAEGSILIDGERLKFREVSWGEEKEKAANIAANNHGGEWDYPGLISWLTELDSINLDMELLGYDREELEDLFAPVEPKEKKPKSCPHCGKEI